MTSRTTFIHISTFDGDRPEASTVQRAQDPDRIWSRDLKKGMVTEFPNQSLPSFAFDLLSFASLGESF